MDVFEHLLWNKRFILLNLTMHVPNTHIAITNGIATLGKFGLAMGICGLAVDVVGEETVLLSSCALTFFSAVEKFNTS